jgi:phosphonate transport system substrate-binding protein
MSIRKSCLAATLLASAALVICACSDESKKSAAPAAKPGPSEPHEKTEPPAPTKPPTADATGSGTAADAGDRASWPKTLNVSAIPDIKNRDEFLTMYTAFTDRLTKELGVEVTFVPVTDYPATVDGLAAKRLDVVWYGGYTSVQAARASKGNLERLVCREEDRHFKSVFVAAPESGITSLEALKGKTFSFGSESSTSGHLMPRKFLLDAGLDPAKDFAKTSFSGAHDATVKAVEAGTVQAGALNYIVWNQMTEGKKYDPAKVAVFWTTPEYVDYCWCARKDLPAGLRAAIKRFFTSLDPAKPEDKKLLNLQKATKFVEAQDEWWKGIEEAAQSANMLKD